MEKINPEVDPCDNFYEYACGKWLKSTLIPEDHYRLSKFITLNRELDIALKIK